MYIFCFIREYRQNEYSLNLTYLTNVPDWQLDPVTPILH